LILGDIDKTIELYLALMEEAKARALSINTLTLDQRRIPSPFIREYCFLQQRMLCEIIGLSCLIAHGDIEATNKNDLRKAYDPATILKILEKLHSDFYPAPARPLKTKDGWHFDNYIGGPYLKQEELPVLYGKCGDLLHKGSLKKLVSRRSPIQNNFEDVNVWGQKNTESSKRSSNYLNHW
jgi:hypothetical protein